MVNFLISRVESDNLTVVRGNCQIRVVFMCLVDLIEMLGCVCAGKFEEIKST